jgi:hypothetical protein
MPLLIPQNFSNRQWTAGLQAPASRQIGLPVLPPISYSGEHQNGEPEVPDPAKLLNTIKQATAHLKAIPGRSGKYVELSGCKDVQITGDLHGHLGNFKHLLQHAKLSENPERHVILQELVHGPYRYPEGGDLSHRLVDVVCAYICQFPGRVHYLLGNHELSQYTQREIAKSNENLNSLYIAGVNLAYGEQAESIMAAYYELFDALPVIIRLPNRIVISHSLPGASRLENWTLETIKKEVFTPEDYQLGGCVHAVVWGRDTSEATTKKYLELVDADLLVSGHIPTDAGYEVPNPYQVILDGKDEDAHGLLIPTGEPLTQEQLLKYLFKLSEVTA